MPTFKVTDTRLPLATDHLVAKKDRFRHDLNFNAQQDLVSQDKSRRTYERLLGDWSGTCTTQGNHAGFLVCLAAEAHRFNFTLYLKTRNEIETVLMNLKEEKLFIEKECIQLSSICDFPTTSHATLGSEMKDGDLCDDTSTESCLEGLTAELFESDVETDSLASSTKPSCAPSPSLFPNVVDNDIMAINQNMLMNTQSPLIKLTLSLMYERGKYPRPLNPYTPHQGPKDEVASYILHEIDKGSRTLSLTKRYEALLKEIMILEQKLQNLGNQWMSFRQELLGCVRVAAHLLRSDEDFYTDSLSEFRHLQLFNRVWKAE